MNQAAQIPFDNSYASLPEQFYARLGPEPVSRPGLIRVNHRLADYLGIDSDWLESAEGVAVIAGNSIPAGADPIATVYAGHQFGGWNPQLGDGRAILLGEIVAADGERHDLQLKGSGRTPWSRGGDGRAPIGPVLREYIVSEAMAAMGIATSRALAAVTSGDMVMREQALPGAVLARVAQSHIRIGTFQFFSSRQDTEALSVLLEHVIQRHYPLAAKADNPAAAVLEQVVARQAKLVASWQQLGFIHGVMNTDNMLISGETIDYGPCAFMDTFHPDTVFSSIDHNGRYAYRNQAGIAHWNLACLAQAMLPLINPDQDKAAANAQAIIDTYPDLFLDAHVRGMNQKLGLTGSEPGDEALAQELLELMAEEATDFTLTFRHLSDLVDPRSEAGGTVAELFNLPEAFGGWLDKWRQRSAADPRDAGSRQADMYRVNPVYIPRNHLVEEAITAATEGSDFGLFHKLVDITTAPYDYVPGQAIYATPPRPEQVVTQTFCGT